jgi:release factor glutamine methyltransferase
VTPALVWRDLLREAETRLGSKAEARHIVQRASGNDGADYLPGLDRSAPDRAHDFFHRMLERREAGEPLQYVLGEWGFRTLDLYLDRRVLIPRPETEMVVQVALAELPGGQRTTVVDLGTGSGAIALSIAVETPTAHVWATDASEDALAVARANLAGIGTYPATRVQLAHGDWFDALPRELEGRVNLIVSNPPYIADDEELPSEVEDWEPRAALRAGPTGLEAIGVIIDQARGWLTQPGALVLEIAPHQSADTTHLATDAGFRDVETRLDLAGRERVLVARW